jgi:hypothetical protein
MPPTVDLLQNPTQETSKSKQVLIIILLYGGQCYDVDENGSR